MREIELKREVADQLTTLLYALRPRLYMSWRERIDVLVKFLEEHNIKCEVRQYSMYFMREYNYSLNKQFVYSPKYDTFRLKVEIKSKEGWDFFLNIPDEDLPKVNKIYNKMYLQKQKGEEIANALHERFPFTKRVPRSFRLYLLLSRYSKEEVLETFQRNYAELASKLNLSGLDEKDVAFLHLTAAALNKTLYNQKDFFLCRLEEVEYEPHFPIRRTSSFGTFVLKNGYEYLAFELLDTLPYEAKVVYFKRYKNDQNKMFDLSLASAYYKFVIKLQQSYVNKFDYEKTLNSFLDTVEKALIKGKKSIIEVFL